MAGAVLFGAAILYGLRTWWVDAVGTTRLALVVAPGPLVLGALGGLVAAAVTLLLTLRRLGTSAPKDLLSGLALMASPAPKTGRGRPWLRFAIGAVLAASLVAASVTGAMPQTAAFFAAGGVLLVALLMTLSAWLRRAPAGTITGHGQTAVARLGIRQATAHPGRSVLSVALIAFATFVIVSVGAFKRGAPENDRDPQSGTGGYTLYAESVVPVMFDPGTPAGRAELGPRRRRPPRRDNHAIPAASRRGRQLPESLQAHQSPHRRTRAPVRGRRRLQLRGIDGRDRRRAAEPVASPGSQVPRRRGAGHRRRQLAAVRPARRCRRGLPAPRARRQARGAARGRGALGQRVPVGARHRGDAVRAAVPATGGIPILHGPCAGRPQHRSGHGTRGWSGRLRLRRAVHRRAPGVLSPGREHLSLDIPGTGRAGFAAGHAGAGRDSVAQRAGATSRAGAAAGGGLRRTHAGADGRG